MIDIEICLGSSCFARGNRQALELLEERIGERNLEDCVSLKGRLCLDLCSCGPHVIVNGIRHELMAPDGILEILDRALEEQK